MRNFYEVLGVGQDANLDEIKTAFRKLAKNYHPDQHPGDEWAERRFVEVNEAYETLSDGTLRSAYDRELADWHAVEAQIETSAEQPDRRPGMRVILVSVALTCLAVGAAAWLLTRQASFESAPTLADSKSADIPAGDERRPEEPPATPPAAAPRDHDFVRDAKTAIEKAGQTLSEAPPAEEWHHLEDSRDVAALQDFAARRRGTSEGEAALSRMHRLIDEADDAEAVKTMLAPVTDPDVTAHGEARLADIARREASREQDSEWSEAEKDGSKAALVRYLAAYPESPHAAEARAHLKSLRLIETPVGSKGEASSEWLEAGESFRDCRDCPLMVLVAPGEAAKEARSGDPTTESPGTALQKARLGRPLAVGQVAVTIGEWDACVSDGGCAGPRSGRGDAGEAVMNISWNDAQAYARWLRKKTGRAYRLLKSNEWEFVALSAHEAQPGSRRRDDERGVRLAGGPVLEWVEDCWSGDDPNQTARGCSERVLIGNVNFGDASQSTVHGRFGDAPENKDGLYTFRVARPL